MPTVIFLSYWEFVRDIVPHEAIAFYNFEAQAPEHDNGAIALSAVFAPEEEPEPYQWSLEIWKKERAKEPKGLLSNMYIDESGDIQFGGHSTDRLEIRQPEHPRHYLCWMSGEILDNLEKDCISDDEMEKYLAENDLLLTRYARALRYQNSDFVFGPPVDQDYIGLSRLLDIALWRNRDSLSQADLTLTVDFLHFWKTASESASASHIGYAVFLVNSGLAVHLFFNLLQIYPQLISIYEQRHGKFYVEKLDQIDIDRIEKAEFASVDSLLCIGSVFNFSYSYCKPNEKLNRYFYKPGRTLQAIYVNRTTRYECSKTIKTHDVPIELETTLYKLHALLRPGNFKGRLIGGQGYLRDYMRRSECEMFESYEIKNEIFGLLRLFSEFKSHNFSATYINHLWLINKELFRLHQLDGYYQWSAQKETLSYITNKGSSFEYSYQLQY
ncbi:MAG: hypothetical protein AAF434_00240 [Pseudomonadota bacterium]